MTFNLCKWRATVSKTVPTMLAPEAQRLRLRRVQLTVVASSLRWVATPDEGGERDKHAQFASFCTSVLTHPFTIVRRFV